MKKNYIRGIIGALIGGLIASIPWVFIYVYSDELYAVLALIISIGVVIGYQKFKGKVDEKFPTIVVLVSLLCVTIATFIIIPFLIVSKSGGGNVFFNYQIIMGDSSFIDALMDVYVISLIFTIIGISGTVKTVKEAIKNSKDKNNIEILVGSGTKKEKESIKNYFITNKALDEERAIKLPKNHKFKLNALAKLLEDGIIVQKEDKYYYSIAKDQTINNAEKKSNKMVLTIFLIFLGLFIIIGISAPDTPQEEINERVEKNISFVIPNDYIEQVDKDSTNSWYYYHENDITASKGHINVYYHMTELTFEKKELKAIKTKFEKLDNVKKVTQNEIFTTSNNLKAIEYILEYEEYKDYIYYISGTNKTALVEIIDYGLLPNLLEDGKRVVDTFSWTK